MIVFLFIQVIKFVISVVEQMVMFWGIIIRKIMTDIHFRKKSIYQRKYHYEKKIDQVSKRLHLTDEQRYYLYNKLMMIDNHVMEILNKQFCRKRMISIFYLIKKFLEEMGDEKYKLGCLKISTQTLENYEKWWNTYMPTLPDYPGVSRIRHQSPGLPYGSLYLPDKIIF